MKAKLQAARSLSGRHWLLLSQSWFMLLAVDLGLRMVPFSFVQKFLSKGSKASASEAVEAEDRMPDIVRIVDIAARHHLYPMTCLRRALVLQWLLARRGVQTQLRFGVRKDDQKLDAHAWLEFRGQPIGDPQSNLDEYTPLAATKSG